MENFEKQLMEIENALADKLKVLEILEAEKRDIIQKYNNASNIERYKIRKEMKASETKFKMLSEEMLALKQQVKMIKNKA